MLDGFRRRYLDVLGSIYIYNEHRGYTALDRVLEAVRTHFPKNHDFIAAIEKHRADEYKHYWMFKRWFERRDTMPYALDRTFGHIDRFIGIMFGSTIDRLDTKAVIGSGEEFAKLCRVIALTERRGFQQIDILLRNRIVRNDKILTRIFRIIEKDEPSHWSPYEGWLDSRGGRAAGWWERLIDRFIHSELMVLKIPVLFVIPKLARRTRWPHEDDPADRPTSPAEIAGAPRAGLPANIQGEARVEPAGLAASAGRT
jgi:hypothetical protein